ncbi:MAG: hypothetical protein SOT91_05415 [Bacilli bacterium]|nr:hypothetical protein [Clostridium sp.]MDY2804780.1 hypothetical protein [Bacilli bacterium]
MIIRKISCDNINYKNIFGELDIENRILHFNLDNQEFKDIFGFYVDERSDNSDKLDVYKNCYLIDENGVYYTCNGCIWVYSRKAKCSFIKVYTLPIDIIYENKIVSECNLDNIKIKKMLLKTSYPLYAKFKWHIANFNIKYDARKKISILPTKSDDKFNIDLLIESNIDTTFKTLSNILYSILELIFLIFGDIPKLESIILCDNNSEFKLYRELVDKYHQRVQINPNNEIIGNIDSHALTPKLIRDFIKFRKETKILFDMLMINMNNNGYLEINNSSLLQLLEGLFKTIGPFTTENFREILNYYFKNNKSTNYLLSKRDKKLINVGTSNDKDYVFIIKGVGHRNYLSHLDVHTNRKVFIESENNYAYWKLSLCARLYITDYIGFTIDKELVKKTLISFDKWAITKHFRYKI